MDSMLRSPRRLWLLSVEVKSATVVLRCQILYQQRSSYEVINFLGSLISPERSLDKELIRLERNVLLRLRK